MSTDITNIQNQNYNEILEQVISIIESSRMYAARQVCSASGQMRWGIGQMLYERKIESGYGDGVVQRLSVDLSVRYPKLGTSPRNLWDMKKFFVRFKDSDLKLRQLIAVLQWGHTLLLMRKFESQEQDAAVYYYASETLARHWNKDLMLNAVKMKMHETHALTPLDNNFSRTLPSEQAAYANEVFKDRYNLGFLGVTNPILELELENRLVSKITRFLMELGKGFTFIGNQHVLEYNGKESRVDMLFFHRGLRALVAIDLKIGAFKPEYAGKMNYYLSLLDRLERGENENRSIGIILCAEKDHVDVELALEDFHKPIGVADYSLIVPKEELQKVLTDEIRAFEDDVENNKRLEKD